MKIPFTGVSEAKEFVSRAMRGDAAAHRSLRQQLYDFSALNPEERQELLRHAKELESEPDLFWHVRNYLQGHITFKSERFDQLRDQIGRG